MIVSKLHKDKFQWEYYITKWRDIIKKAFNYTYKVVVMDGKYGSIPDHWHICLTDLEQGSDDFYQILGIPWLSIIDVKPWKEDP